MLPAEHKVASAAELLALQRLPGLRDSSATTVAECDSGFTPTGLFLPVGLEPIPVGNRLLETLLYMTLMRDFRSWKVEALNSGIPFLKLGKSEGGQTGVGVSNAFQPVPRILLAAIIRGLQFVLVRLA